MCRKSWSMCLNLGSAKILLRSCVPVKISTAQRQTRCVSERCWRLTLFGRLSPLPPSPPSPPKLPVAMEPEPGKLEGLPAVVAMVFVGCKRVSARARSSTKCIQAHLAMVRAHVYAVWVQERRRPQPLSKTKHHSSTFLGHANPRYSFVFLLTGF